MNVREVYAAYRIMPGLQMHQMRVAAVAELVFSHFDQPLRERTIVLACLFHDMGNLIKSDFAQFPEFLEPQGVEYWQGVKDEFIAKYGNKSHEANVKIAQELQLPPPVVALIDGIGFGSMAKTAAADSWEQKIVEYADCRVGPHGVLSLEERLVSTRERYLSRGDREYYEEAGFIALKKSAHEIEDQLFAHAQIGPSAINDESAAPIIDRLWEYQVS